MPVQIAIRSNIHNDLEPKIAILEGAPNLLPSRGPVQKVSFHQSALFRFIQALRFVQCLILASMDLLENDPRQDLHL